MRARRGLWIAAAVILVGCSTRTTDPQFNNPLDPRNGSDLAPPDSIGALVAPDRVELTWTGPSGVQVDEFAVFRKQTDDPVSDYELVGRVPDRTFTDRQVRTGHTYAYEISSGRNNRFGKRSAEVDVEPGLFTIVLANGIPVTNQRFVQATLSGPSNTTAVQLSEDPGFPGEPWRVYSGGWTWTFSPGDGDKTVYARFRTSDGNESFPVFDSITLDTRAVINSVSFDGATVRQPGDAVHFRVDAGERGGQAAIDVTSVFSGLRLFDDGTSGDSAPGDGIYERDAVIPAGGTVTSAAVRGSFTDAAGNVATPLSAPRTLTVRQAPDPVQLVELLPAEPPDPAKVTVRWTQSLDGDFSAYRIYRDTTPGVTESDHLAGTVTSRGTVEFGDPDVEEGATYYYRVFVRTGAGLEAGSNEVRIDVPNLRPPFPVTLNVPDGVGYNRISLSWSRSVDLDFAAYRVYRNHDGAVDDGDSLVAEITDQTRTFVDDGGREENTEYHYRVYVVDTAGLASRSNEIQTRTQNLAPPAVTLNAPTSVTATGATLRWTRSNAHDFQAYRVYRDVTGAVSTASTLVGEILDSADTGFRDDSLEPGTLYYYRVFVVDEGPDSKSTGSNVVSLTTSSSF